MGDELDDVINKVIYLQPVSQPQPAPSYAEKLRDWAQKTRGKIENSTDNPFDSSDPTLRDLGTHLVKDPTVGLLRIIEGLTTAHLAGEKVDPTKRAGAQLPGLATAAAGALGASQFLAPEDKPVVDAMEAGKKALTDYAGEALASGLHSEPEVNELVGKVNDLLAPPAPEVDPLTEYLKLGHGASQIAKSNPAGSDTQLGLEEATRAVSNEAAQHWLEQAHGEAGNFLNEKGVLRNDLIGQEGGELTARHVDKVNEPFSIVGNIRVRSNAKAILKEYEENSEFKDLTDAGRQYVHNNEALTSASRDLLGMDLLNPPVAPMVNGKQVRGYYVSPLQYTDGTKWTPPNQMVPNVTTSGIMELDEAKQHAAVLHSALRGVDLNEVPKHRGMSFEETLSSPHPPGLEGLEAQMDAALTEELTLQKKLGKTFMEDPQVAAAHQKYQELSDKWEEAHGPGDQQKLISSYGPGDQYLLAQPGDVIRLPLSSFSTNKDTAESFAGTADQSLGVILHLEGPHKSISMTPLSHFAEYEHLTAGEFEITRVEKDPGEPDWAGLEGSYGLPAPIPKMKKIWASQDQIKADYAKATKQGTVPPDLEEKYELLLTIEARPKNMHVYLKQKGVF